jgi:energy-coupling factor transporter ATP-binding protein EcfA2
MQLKMIRYREYEGRDQEWILDGLALGPCNLLVGRNATGKTRTLNLVSGLARMLSKQISPAVLSGSYDATFDHDGQEAVYHLRIEAEQVVEESYALAGRTLLKRGAKGVGKIFAKELGKEVAFQSPESELAAVVRRDGLQHPFLQPLHDWGASVRHYHFGSSLGKDRFAIVMPRGAALAANDADDCDENQVVGVFRKAARELGETAFKQALLRDLESVDYPATDVGVGPPSSVRGLPSELVGLWVKEKGLKSVTDQHTMSQGMFRVLSLLTLTNYLVMARKAGCILVDDIGEGLDFGRSCQLIDLLREKAGRSMVQLVVSTNDKFVMNRVPLEEWSVLQRRGGEVRVLNVANSRELFEEFKFTGLSNFSFLEMDFASGAPEAVAHE